MTYLKPYLGHLQKYDCKTYAIDKHFSQKEKLTKKVHIDFFLKYDSINIFFNMNFSQRKVIRTKNVIVNEKKFYQSLFYMKKPRSIILAMVLAKNVLVHSTLPAAVRWYERSEFGLAIRTALGPDQAWGGIT